MPGPNDLWEGMSIQLTRGAGSPQPFLWMIHGSGRRLSTSPLWVHPTHSNAWLAGSATTPNGEGGAIESDKGGSRVGEDGEKPERERAWQNAMFGQALVS